MFLWDSDYYQTSVDSLLWNERTIYCLLFVFAAYFHWKTDEVKFVKKCWPSYCIVSALSCSSEQLYLDWSLGVIFVRFVLWSRSRNVVGDGHTGVFCLVYFVLAYSKWSWMALRGSTSTGQTKVMCYWSALGNCYRSCVVFLFLVFLFLICQQLSLNMASHMGG